MSSDWTSRTSMYSKDLNNIQRTTDIKSISFMLCKKNFLFFTVERHRSAYHTKQPFTDFSAGHTHSGIKGMLTFVIVEASNYPCCKAPQGLKLLIQHASESMQNSCTSGIPTHFPMQ